MDRDLLHKATAQAKTKWLEKALKTLLPQVWDLSIHTPDTQEKVAAWAQQIDQMFAAQKLTTPSQQKNRRTDIVNALRVLHPEHPAIAHVLLPSNVYTVMNNEQASRLNARENKFFTSQQANLLVERAIALLESDEPDEVAAGLSVLVGRRISEILLSQFKPKTAYSLLFSEAVKRRGEVGLEFEIPTLAPADLVLRAIAHLKQVWSIEELRALNLPNNHLKRRINAKYSGVPHACRKHFADLVPGREAENDDGERLYTHLFRAVYAEIATYYYKPQWVPDHRFKAEIQGHFKLTTDGQKLPNYSARQNYDDYLIRDRSPGESGVKLGLPGVEILEVFQKEAAMVEDEDSGSIVTGESPEAHLRLEQGTINALLYRAVDRLLFSKEWAEVATGLLLVTGRTIDTLLSAIPSPKTGFSILVEGVEVPTLTTANQVISAWNQFRQLAPLPLPEIDGAVQAVGDRSFHDLVPLHGVEALRALYSCLALHWFCPPAVPEADFLSAIAAPNPRPFETVNPNRGVKLAQHNVEVLACFQSQAHSVHPEEVAAMPDTPHEAATVAEAPTELAPNKLRPRRKSVSVDADLLRSVAANFGLEIRGKGGTVGLSYESALAELLSLLAEPEGVRSPAEGPSHEAILTTTPPTAPSDPTLAIALADQARTLAWLTGRLEALEQEVHTLRQERDAAIALVNQGNSSPEWERLQQENQRLQQERDLATNKLEAFRNLLIGDRDGQSNRQSNQEFGAIAGSLPVPQKPFAPTSQAASHSQSAPATKSATPSQAVPSKPARKRLPEDQALDNIRRAVHAIMDFNNQGDRTLNEKWYISFPVLQTLLRANGLSANQNNVSTVFEEMQQALEQHHDQHHLGSRHNRRHPDISKIAQLVFLDS
uniref:protelomerase family protein n=1 Tax=Trichocoleus desertorum TaxID=1481672 RepID=UPI0025B343E4|nr:protelomerase family protein [Trichocoleus desertorum]